MQEPTTKEQLLALLEESDGKFLSGETAAKRLSVSRTAIWKAAEALRNDGYRIDAIRNKGYRLSPEADILSEREIRKHLSPICEDIELDITPIVDSTNERVRKQAIAGTPEGYAAIAITQTSGKGRRGRSFYSPPDTGLYLSLLLRPRHCTAQQAAQLTTMAAVAACEAIEAISEETPQIKWVNDIYIAGKKVCGILTKASTSLEDGLVEYAILGIGFNVFPPKSGFPRELENIAGSIFRERRCNERSRLAAEFLNRFMAHYTALYDAAPRDFAPSNAHAAASHNSAPFGIPPHSSMSNANAAQRLAPEDAVLRDAPPHIAQHNLNLLESYRSHSLLTGKPIDVISPHGSKRATALGIDEDYRLIVEYEDGSQEHLSSAEISVKPQPTSGA